MAASLVLSFSGRAAAADDMIVSLAERVPADAALAIFSADVGATCAAFQKTTLGAALSGKDFLPLVNELERLDQSGPLHLRPAFGFDWSDLAGVHDPGALVIFPLADGAPGAAWLFLSTQAAGEVPSSLAAANNYFKEKGYREAIVERPAARLNVLHPPAARKSDVARVLFAAPGFYGVANSQVAAAALLKVTAGKSLATQDAFKQRPPITEGDGGARPANVCFCLRPLALQELLRRSPAGPETKADESHKGEDPRAKAHRLGWDAVQFVAGTLDFTAAEPCQWQIEAAIRAPGPYRGALRMLELISGPFPEPPAWIPADIVSLGAWRWDVPLAMKGFGSVFDEANEPGPDGEGMFEDLLDGLRDDPEGVQVDLRRDLFAGLAPDMLRAAFEAKEGALDKSPALRWLYVAGVRDAVAVKNAFTRFYKNDNKVTHVVRDEYDVWTVGEGASLFVEGESDSIVTVRALALGRGQMLFSTDPELLDLAMHAPAARSPLTDDAGWKRLLVWIKGHEDQHTAFRSLVRADRVLEPGYRAATTKPQDDHDSLAAQLCRLLLFGAAKHSPTLPYAKAPSYDHVRGALLRSAIVAGRTADGWTIRLGGLAPQAGKSD